MHLHTHKILFNFLNFESIGIDSQYLPKILIYLGLKIRFPDISDLLPRFDNFFFCAPELLKGNDFDLKVDVFSFGMVLQGLVTNCIPYFGEKYESKNHCNTFFIQKSIIECKRPMLDPQPQYSKVNELISVCWDDNPNKRPSFVDIVLFLNNNGPLFPETDILDYERVTTYIFSKSDIPEKDKIRFSDSNQERFMQVFDKINKGLGNAEDYYLIGLLYKKGLGCPKSITLASKNFKIAADKQMIEAKYQLGFIYLELKKTQENIFSFNVAHESEKYFKELYELKYYPAYIPLGRLYDLKFKEFGISIDEAAERSAKIYKELLLLLNETKIDKLEEEKSEIMEVYANAECFLAGDLNLLANIKYITNKQKFNELQIERNKLLEHAYKILPTAIPEFVDSLLIMKRKEEAIKIIRDAKKNNPTGAILSKFGDLCQSGIIDFNLENEENNNNINNNNSNITNDNSNITNDNSNINNDNSNINNDNSNITNDNSNITNDNSNITNDNSNINNDNIDRALKVYEEAIKYRSVVAKRKAAMIYENYKLDYKRAAELYEEASKAGDSLSKINLANMIIEGRGVEQNSFHGEHLLLDVIKLESEGTFIAYARLGMLYMEGRMSHQYGTISENLEKAKKYLEKAKQECLPHFKEDPKIKSLMEQVDECLKRLEK